MIEVSVCVRVYELGRLAENFAKSNLLSEIFECDVRMKLTNKIYHIINR